MKAKILVIISLIFFLSGCSIKKTTDDFKFCSSDYVASTYFHHSRIKEISLRLTKITPDRIQVHEDGDNLSMYYCNIESKTEILLAVYKVVKVTDNQDNEIRPSQTTMPTDSPIDETNGESAVRLVQLMTNFKDKFTSQEDISYYEKNKLDNLPFVISTLCSDTYTNGYHSVENFSGSVSASLLLDTPPSQIQLVKTGNGISVLYCVFNDTSDRAVTLGMITVLDIKQVEFERSLSTSNFIYPIVENHTYGYGVYFLSGQLPYMNQYIFDTILHTGDETQNLIDQYKASIFDVDTLKLKFRTNGLVFSNPYQ